MFLLILLIAFALDSLNHLSESQSTDVSFPLTKVSCLKLYFSSILIKLLQIQPVILLLGLHIVLFRNDLKI